MIDKRWNSLLEKILITLEFVVLGIFLFWRYKLGITRYFDIDEFAHLHWGYSLFLGERPYTDFFYLFPPFFLYALYPLFALLGRSIAVLIGARIFIYLVFLGLTFILVLLGRKLRSLTFGLLAAIIFVFLPLPLDKMIEIRPDNLALLLALAGLYLFMVGQDPPSHEASARQGRRKKKYLFFSGLCYSLSLGIVPKTVFFLVPPMVVLLYQLFADFTPPGNPFGLPRGSLRHIFSFVLGALLPALLLVGLIMTYGNPAFSIYSMTKMASNVTIALARKFFMRPDLFFYPNDTYYGFPNYSLPYLANLTIYIGASLFAIFRLVSSLSHRDSKKCLREFLVGGTFFANLYAFVYVFPLKHAQYLIPLAPFIAFYAADLLESAVRAIANFPTLFSWGPASSTRPSINSGLARSKRSFTLSEVEGRHPLLGLFYNLLILLVILFLYVVGQQMYARKLTWTNKFALDKIDRLLKTIPQNEPVFDLTGETVFYPNGYYFCCLPYGQYEEALLFKLPNLEKSLSEKKTKYVYTGEIGRLSILPALQAKYIKENFVNYWSDGSLLIKK